MKKIFLLSVTCLAISSLFSQENPTTPKKKEAVNLAGRPNDHFLVQYSYTSWAGKPDSINTNGYSESINAYIMLNFPFNSSPKLSGAAGVGISSDHIFFNETHVGLKEQTLALQFIDQSDTTHFKRNKLVTVYFEIPIELRFTANPMNSDKSFKFALGIKGGAMINAHTRSKDLENKNDVTINPYVMKESSKRYFNIARMLAHARVGWGHFSIYGSYQISRLFKSGVAAGIRPYSIGLTLSGL